MKMEVLRSEVRWLSNRVSRTGSNKRKNPSRGATKFSRSKATMKMEVLRSEGIYA